MPVDRQRMRPWLEEQINSAKIQGLQWVNKEEKIFQIPWMHAARHGWDLDKDAPLFMNWAVHTGKYHPGVDKPDPKTWKANFRCAMNSLPDIEEVKDKSMKRGSNAFRVYRMLSPAEKAAKKVKKKMEREPKMRRRKSKNAEPESDPVQLKEDTLPDSTVLLAAEPDQPCNSSTPNKLVGSDPPDVCAVVEITTENEESAVSSTQFSFPLQVSPISACNAESGDESTHSEEDCMEIVHVQDLSTSSSSSVRSSLSVLRIPSSLPDRTESFITSGKTNFWVTSCREESPLIAYDEPPWRPFLSSFPFKPAPAIDLSSSMPSRASVIMQAMDLSSTAGKRQ
ncbi:interferon regulatory factor 2a isoform X1 [Colossoma macropomum]|uniref:interferon regulatory factor 2a isoform X1 n=1 Tax=Colossoma macropomum TaxID=42526 RepID=UPI0018645C7E|nr:interferon regulatory factor 2a isoform X1 [Colossoma macropomum]